MMPLKTIKGMILVIGFVLIAQGTAHAQSVEVAGSTSGIFTSTGTAAAGGITYTDSNFDVTTVNGGAAIGAAPTPSTGNIDNLGSFNFNSNGAQTYNDVFKLTVTFTLPPNITSGNNPSTYTATVTGSVDGTQHGGVFINFNNNKQTFAYTTPGGQTGQFTLFVNDISLEPTAGTGHPPDVPVTGTLTATNPTVTVIPEPGALALFLPGLFGLGGFLKRRKVV